MANIYNIKELNLDIINPSAFSYKDKGGSKIIVLGKPGTGKSFLISDLCYKKSHIIPMGMILNGTEDSNHLYEKFFPKSFIYDSFNLDKLKDFIQRQKIAIEYLKNPWSLLVIDDCMDDPKSFKHKIIRSLILNGRHYKMFMVIGLQYSLDLLPVIRQNIDGVFIFRENSVIARKKIWENFASIIPDFSIFCNLLDEITQDNTALYIHNAGVSNKIEDCVFWYKADPVPKNFKFGSKYFWKWNEKRLKKL